jgi:membrane associated rhomboid family serine protease
VVPVRVRAKWLLLFWFGSQFFLDPNQGVAWGAHVGGFVAGVLVALVS